MTCAAVPGDAVVLERDLNVIVEGVFEGRRTFGNIMKHIMMGTSSPTCSSLSVL